MNRPFRVVLFAALLFVPLVDTHAQAPGKAKGFAPARTPAKTVVPTIVVPAPARPTEVKRIEVDAESEPAEAYRTCTAGVESIEILSDKTMKWTFFIMNREKIPRAFCST
ncbi:hypothetical protein [Singulisphaera sp. PoT]|uniref:hypothetical protein n=1 Tax=Singulisphaera sp. PoT TaxID=3411797 RepID=UPI003BF53398